MLVVDVQEKLLPAMSESDLLLRNTFILVQAFLQFRRPVVFSEQYPEGLGATVPDLLSGVEQPVVIEKTRFSALTAVSGFRSKTIVISGIEAHVCVRQTALDLLEQGKSVVVVADAVASRDPEHKRLALDELRHRGALVVSAESLLFEWLDDSRHPLFKTISQLIK